MSNLSESIVRVCVNNTLSLMRSRTNLQWAPDSYWWPGIQLAWVNPFWPGSCGKALTADQLNQRLIEFGVPAESIKKSGRHTMLELGNISFVYRDKQYKYDGPVLQMSPHIPGKKFSECGHAFVNPRCSADELVTFMLAINESVPAAQSASLDAYQDGLRERKEREIRQQVADEYFSRLFNGDIPGEIVSCTIADSVPGAMDLIRFTIRDNGVQWSSNRAFDIPFSERDSLPGPDWIRDFISDPHLLNAIMEIFDDDESGESVPVLKITSSLDVDTEDGRRR